MESVKDKQKKVYDAFKAQFGYKNVMQAPRLVKVVVTSGVGSLKDKNKEKLIVDRLTRITGQAPKSTTAKKSIASFKSRTGMVIGYQITLRGTRMYGFLDKLIHIALPRTRDFRGLKPTAIDDMGNITIGIKEHTIFPECQNEDIKDVFGFGITLVTTAKTKEETEAFLRHLGLPLVKPE